MMVSPEFLYLEEPGREQISDFALATRLSYFLWKTTPDAELLSLAAQGKLVGGSDPEESRSRDFSRIRKSKRFIEDFTGQWLDLYDIDFTEPDQKLFPEYDELLRAAMLAESRLIFHRDPGEGFECREFHRFRLDDPEQSPRRALRDSRGGRAHLSSGFLFRRTVPGEESSPRRRF